MYGIIIEVNKMRKVTLKDADAQNKYICLLKMKRIYVWMTQEKDKDFFF